ncbi:MaoC/PaaZ C-terminal domain-containing protein [Actinomycetospora flava]|uniref:MaoC/PaaZ C-terminal domain-containing protein n=1 Tax=Actinomycetospora flava TaxID=3129232 RepID=A0ABU8M1E3_9PSEU
MADRWFEDFAVGERWTSPPRPVTAEDLADFTRVSGDDHPLHAGPDAILQGPFGVAVAMGLLQRLDIHGDAVLGLLDTHWAYRRPVRVGDVLTLEVTIVRCRRTSAGDRGVVTRAMRLRNDAGETVQEGTTAAMIAARREGPDAVGRAFGTVAWAEALADEVDLADDLAGWDGTIGLRSGDDSGGDEAHLRVYRGRVIEVSRRAPRGATFTLGADPATWLELVEAPDNPFMRLAMAGRFTVTGDGYEYLRLTSALHRLADAAREIA